MPTPTNKDEELLDKALDSLIDWILGHDDEELGNIDFRKAKREVLIVADRVANTKVAEVLNRLEESNNLGIWTTSTESLVEVHQKTISKAIQAERNKLTQEEGSDEIHG